MILISDNCLNRISCIMRRVFLDRSLLQNKIDKANAKLDRVRIFRRGNRLSKKSYPTAQAGAMESKISSILSLLVCQPMKVG